MVPFLLQESMEFDIELSKNDNKFFVESGLDILNSVSGFIKRLIEIIKNFINRLKEMIIKEVKQKQFAVHIALAKKNMNKLKKMGINTIEFADVIKIEKLMDAEVKNLTKLTNNFMQGYALKGRGAVMSELYMSQYKHYLNKYQELIEAEKNKKKPMKIETVLAWLEANINWNGAAIGHSQDYINSLEGLSKQFEKIENATKRYEEENGYVIMGATFKDILNNNTVYVKKNIDWLSLYALSGAAMLTSFIIKMEAKKYYADRVYADHPVLKGEDLDVIDRWVNTYWNDETIYKHPLKTIQGYVNNAGAALSVGATAEFLDAVNKRKNSIHIED